MISVALSETMRTKSFVGTKDVAFGSDLVDSKPMHYWGKSGLKSVVACLHSSERSGASFSDAITRLM